MNSENTTTPPGPALKATPETEERTPGVIPWPNPIGEAGHYGIAGEFVRMVEPHTEADPNVLLITFLAYAGNALGRNCYALAGADRHCGNLYLCIVGPTGHGRKGSALSAVEAFFRHNSKLGHLLYGISSGEGVIWEIRDPIIKREPNKATKQFEDVTVDEGIRDKRLLLSLSEFHQCISAMRRQDSILSSIFRQAWDRDIISAPSKTSPATATGAHLSIVGCITREELLLETDSADAENGTLNRCLYAASRRSKYLPEGGRFFEVLESPEWADLQRRFADNLDSITGGPPFRFKRDGNAADDWGFDSNPNVGMYRPLSLARAGLWGAVTVRAPQQVIRLSLIIAAINGAREIRSEHQQAAYAIWRYCDASARYIFARVDNPMATAILNALRFAGKDGLTRTQIYKLWNGKKSAVEVQAALTLLSTAGIIRLEVEETAGRYTEKWFDM